MSLALAAVVGLAYLGHKMANAENTEVVIAPEKDDSTMKMDDYYDVQQRHISTRSFRHKQEITSLADVTDSGTRTVNGQPVYDLTQREYVSNKMNNLNPNPWNKVGPGIGVGPNVPAYGGYQQLFRVLPVNTNEHRLTQLPGRVQGPPQAPVFAQESRQNVVKNKPELIWSRKNLGDSAVKGAPPTRPLDVKGIRSTLKDQTLESITAAPRTVVDMGHIVTANDPLQRNANGVPRRGKSDREGAPGRMNVRDGPLAMNGMVTSVRIDPENFMVNHGATKMGYIREGIQEANAFKDQPGPSTLYPLDLAKKQLSENPFNHSLN